MGFLIQYEKPDVLKEYGQVSIAFEVLTEFIIELLNQGLGGTILHEVQIEHPYIVDYDADRARGPERWLDRWDTKNWCVISAYDHGERIGGAVVAYDTPNVNFLEGRNDIAALWDIRVKQGYRGKGLGKAIFSKALEWVNSKGCKQFKIETQSNNVAACKFYVSQGAVLGAIERYGYIENPNVSRLTWYINL